MSSSYLNLKKNPLKFNKNIKNSLNYEEAMCSFLMIMRKRKKNPKPQTNPTVLNPCISAERPPPQALVIPH